MRIRTIKPEFYLHEGLFELELETSLPIRIAFTGLWCVADREGRFKWEPRKIGIQILPYDAVDFSRVLDALTTRGFIQKYEVGSLEYGFISSFSRHQVINNRERDSELPEPTPSNICDASTTRQARVATRDQPRKEEGKGRERKGRDLLSDFGRAESSGESVSEYSEDILNLWQSFPAKSRERSSKKKINDEWRKAKNKPPLAEVIAKVEAWANSHDWKKDNGQFAPGAHLWIKDLKWESEIPAPDQLFPQKQIKTNSVHEMGLS